MLLSSYSQSFLAEARLPKLGQKMPCVPDASKQYAIAQAQLAEGCEAIISDITYFFGTTDHKTIAYISTRDPKFRTPEGIHVGNTLIDVLSVNGGAPIEERGWAFYSILRSGWRAEYPGLPGSGGDFGKAPEQSSKVVKLFIQR
jgi:hypothetical protein